MPGAERSTSTTSSSEPSPKLDPKTYRALKTEQGVFTTPPYSGELKGLWKFKDADAARESSRALWDRFLIYKENDDFVGMDITRKFIQMGRTRSLRYALRKGGRKYEAPASNPDVDHDHDRAIHEKGKGKRKRSKNDESDDDAEDQNQEHRNAGSGSVTRAGGRKEIPRTGEVFDESKLEGANVFEGYLDRCWADKVYAQAWEDWRDAGKREADSAKSVKGVKDDTTTTKTTTEKSRRTR